MVYLNNKECLQPAITVKEADVTLYSTVMKKEINIQGMRNFIPKWTPSLLVRYAANHVSLSYPSYLHTDVIQTTGIAVKSRTKIIDCRINKFKITIDRHIT